MQSVKTALLAENFLSNDGKRHILLNLMDKKQRKTPTFARQGWVILESFLTVMRVCAVHQTEQRARDPLVRVWVVLC